MPSLIFGHTFLGCIKRQLCFSLEHHTTKSPTVLYLRALPVYSEAGIWRELRY